MALITADELARGAIVVVFGGGAGALAMAAPGSLWWTAPALAGLIAGAATVPEVRDELQRSAPHLLAGATTATAHGRRMLEGVGLARSHQGRPGAEGSGRAAGAATELPTKKPPDRTSARQEQAPRPPRADPAVERGRALIRAPLYDSDPDRARGPTIFAAKSRHGKSQAQIACIVEDIASGAEVVWMSKHATLYHPKDQPVDLRPLADRFDLVTKGPAICERLDYYVNDVMEERLERYTLGQDVGHPVALHIGEWPVLHEQYGEKVAAPMRRLLREAPKTQIIVSLDAQDAQVSTLGLGSGLRNSFWTKVIGNVDEPSWRGLTDEPYRKMPARQWFVPGRGTIVIPQAIERAAELVSPAPAIEPEAAPPERKRQAVAAQGARPAVVSARVPAPDPLLAGLLAQAEAPRATPAPLDLSALSPERAARLAAIQARQPAAAPQPAPAPAPADAPPAGQQSVTVDQPGGGQVIVNVSQVAPAAGRAGRSRRKGRGGVDTRKMRARADDYRKVRSVIARGGSGNDAQREAQIKRVKALAYARQARAELGIEGGSEEVA